MWEKSGRYYSSPERKYILNFQIRTYSRLRCYKWRKEYLKNIKTSQNKRDKVFHTHTNSDAIKTKLLAHSEHFDYKSFPSLLTSRNNWVNKIWVKTDSNKVLLLAGVRVGDGAAYCKACRILIPWPGIESGPSAAKAWSQQLNQQGIP